MHQTVLVLHYPETIATAIAGALAPEASVAEVPKTRAVIERNGGKVTVRIDADDLGALRAAVNSYLRWADAAERAAGIGRGAGDARGAGAGDR